MSIVKIRPKVVLDAIQFPFSGPDEQFRSVVLQWTEGRAGFALDSVITIPTKWDDEAVFRAHPGDWIVRYLGGGVGVYVDADFLENYEVILGG